MTSSPLRIEIQLVSNALQAVCSHQSLSPTKAMIINKCEYVAQYIELSDMAMSTILGQTNGGPLQFVVSDYKNFSITGNGLLSDTGSTTFTIPIAAKFSSLKSIFVAARESAKSGIITYFPHSCNKFNLQEYAFRLGSTVVPSKSPNSVPEFFTELMKSVGSIGDISQQPSIDFNSYNQNVALPNDETATGVGMASSGSFYVGLDLENYSGSDRSQLFAGYNSNTDDIYYNPIFGPSVLGTSIRFEAYALFDSVLVCENNTSYVKF
jgi:hypothetical protein